MGKKCGRQSRGWGATGDIYEANKATLFTCKPIMTSSLFLHPAAAGTAATPFRSLGFSTKATPPQNQSFTPEQEKKSFSVVTGKLFLGIAARVLNRNGKSVNGGVEGGVPPEMFMGDEKESEWWWRQQRKEEGIGAVVEDPVKPGVVWKQGKKDVEAERRRKADTSPGFSCSAAGLLFPYHLGVAQLLIEKNYIKVLPP